MTCNIQTTKSKLKSDSNSGGINKTDYDSDGRTFNVLPHIAQGDGLSITLKVMLELAVKLTRPKQDSSVDSFGLRNDFVAGPHILF